MSPLQRIIKIIATIFAVCLAIGIIGSIVTAVIIGVNATSALDNRNDRIESSSGTSSYTTDYEGHFTNISSFDIDAAINTVTMIPGDDFSVKMENVSTMCKVKQDGNCLVITDSTTSGKSFFSWIGDLLDGKAIETLKGGKITITYPENFVGDDCEIDAGTGSLHINNLHVKTLDIEAGTGSVHGTGITSDFIDLEAGTGSVELNECNFNSSDIEAGTGSVSITGALLGENNISCGVGSVYLGLEGSKEDYDLDISKGLGSITIDGTNCSDIETNNSLPNSLTIEGGVGSTTINFSKSF